MRPNLLRLAGAGLGGWLLFTGFAPFNWPFPIAICGAALAIHSISSASKNWTLLTSAVFALSFFLPLLAWLSVIGTDAWIMVTLICSSWWTLALTLGRKSSPFWLAISITAIELVRDRLPWGGFGWGQAGVLWVNGGFSKGILSLIGQVGGTLLFWWFAATLSQFQIKRSFVAALVISLIGIGSLQFSASQTPPTGAQLVMVQGGVEHVGLGTIGSRRAVLERHLNFTLSHLSDLENADLVVWPENASDVDPNTDFFAAEQLTALSQEIDAPLWLGAVVNRSESKVANVLMRYESGNGQEVYAKQRLVPFGEFLPLREILSAYTERTALMPRDFEPGSTSYDEEIGGSRFGNLICFEVADDNLAWDRSSPIDALVIQTNNATYDGSAQSDQQTMYAQTRALELRIPVFVVSTNGQSSIINAKGEVDRSIEQGQVGLLKGRAATQTGWTLAAQIHDFEVISILLLGISRLVAYRRRVRS